MMPERREAPDQIVRTHGQETLRRFRYQLEYALLRWLQCLSDQSASVVSELREDLELLIAEISTERIQVKTKSSGTWSVNTLTSRATPVLNNFYQQYRDDPNLTFRFVSNAPAGSDLTQLQRYAGASRGGELTSDQAKASHQLISRLRNRIKARDDIAEFLKHLELDLAFAGMEDLRYRITDAIGRAASDLYDVTLDPARLVRIYNLLLGLVLDRSASQYIGDRTLTPEALRIILERECTALELSGKVDLKRLSAQLSDQLPQSLSELDQLPVAARGAGSLDEEDTARLQELTKKLQKPTDYSYLPILAADREALADLLEETGKMADAQQQYADGLTDCASDPSAAADIILSLANFLARNNPESRLLEPYLRGYLDFVLDGPSIRWVEATHVFAFAQAAYGEPQYLKALHEALGAKEPEHLSPPQVLHWQEAMAMLEVLGGNVEESITHFDLLLSNAERDPTFNPRRLRNVLAAVGRLLEAHEQFDELFKKFADFYERKEAWGARADLFKDRAFALYKEGQFEKAIPLLDTAAEGYARVAEPRGAALTRHMLIHCLESSGKKLAALSESLSLALWSDAQRVRDISLVALSEAIRITFDLGFLLDALAFALTHARMADAFRDDDALEWSVRTLDLITIAIAAQRSEFELGQARSLLEKTFAAPEFSEWLDLIQAAANADDRRWSELLQREDADLRDSLGSIREGIQASRQAAMPEPIELEIAAGAMRVCCAWRNEPSLKWLLLGIVTWFDRHASDLETFFSDFASRLEFRALPFSEAEWATSSYDYIEDMLRVGYPAVLPSMDANREPLGVIVLPHDLYVQNKANLGAFELPCVHQSVLSIRGLFKGESGRQLTERFERELLARRSFNARMAVPLASSAYHLGAYMLTDA